MRNAGSLSMKARAAEREIVIYAYLGLHRMNAVNRGFPAATVGPACHGLS